MSEHRTFVAMCFDGDAMLDDINKFIAEWHDAETDAPIWEYLGLTECEYASWVEEPVSLRFIINAKRRGVLFSRSELIGSLAARSADPAEAKVLQEWLKRTGRL